MHGVLGLHFEHDCGGEMTDGRRRPTLADVAKDAGLSTSAASLILNEIPDSGLSEDARKRVLESALKLGYRPNKLAKALKTDVTGTIGFVSDSVVTTRFASGLINGALKAASAAAPTAIKIPRNTSASSTPNIKTRW